MRFFKYILIAMTLTLGLASCSVSRYKSYAPSTTQLNIQMDDLQYLGETSISVEYRNYLGIISKIDKVNGELYTGDEVQTFPIFNNNGFADALLPNLNKASYKILEEYPDADYFIVTYQKEEKHQLFLGSNVTSTAKVKAYSLK